MLKIGMVSRWHVHAEGYAKQVQENPGATINAVWDEDPARGKAWAEELGVAFYESYDDFLASDIDAVLCDAPTTAHFELLGKAARAGKHIFTEKLLETTVEKTQMLADEIEKAGVTFTIALSVKSHAPVLYMKQLIESGMLGKITGARFRRSHSGVSSNWLPEYWFNVANTGGGAMMDLGAHPVYIIAELLGAPKRLTALMNNIYGTSSDENAIALAEFEGGALATMETAFVTDGVPDLLEVYGTKGAVFMRGEKVQQNLGDGMEDVPAEKMPAAKEAPLAQFIQACAEGIKAPKGLGLNDALVLTKIVAAAYEAQASGTTVQL